MRDIFVFSFLISFLVIMALGLTGCVVSPYPYGGSYYGGGGGYYGGGGGYGYHHHGGYYHGGY